MTTPEQTEESLSILERIKMFRTEMTMREVRMLSKCQESPEDFGGVLTGVLWLVDRRANPNATFDTYLDMTEAQIIAGLEDKLPKVDSTKN